MQARLALGHPTKEVDFLKKGGLDTSPKDLELSPRPRDVSV